MAMSRGLHSRVVAILKLMLPLVAVLLLASLFLTSTEDGLEGEIVFSTGELPDEGVGLEISRPTFSGQTRADDRFRFTAERVEPDTVPPTRARIIRLTGVIDFTDGRKLELAAATGDLDIEARTVALTGAVRIVTSDGYEITTERLEADLGAGILRADGPVTTHGPIGEISSGRLVIAPGDKGRHVISFDDRVRLVYLPATAKE